MLQELISRAKQIEATTDANISGAVNQVTKSLTIDEMEMIYRETFEGKKLDAKLRDIEAARSGSDRYALVDVKSSINTLVLNRAR